jgi:TonB family protein
MRLFAFARFLSIFCAVLQWPALSQAPPAHLPQIGYLNDGTLPDRTALSPAEASELEERLTQNPEDETIRGELLNYYWRHSLREPRLQSIYWLIEHHPESDLHESQTAGIYAPVPPDQLGMRFPSGVPLNDASDYDRATQLWQTQVDQHPRDPRVLFNAARARSFGDVGAEELALVEKAQKLDPSRFTQPLTVLYVLFALQQRGDPASLALLKARLASSQDAALLGSLAREMLKRAGETSSEGSKGGLQASAVKSEVVDLISRAKELQPENRDWDDLMEGAKALASNSQPERRNGNVASSAPKRLRVAASIADSNLSASTPAFYPPEAKAAGVQGIVRLTVLIGTDGHVKQVTLVSGHPLLIQSAKDAVAQYVYRPIFLDGQSVEVVAPVDIEFR